MTVAVNWDRPSTNTDKNRQPFISTFVQRHKKVDLLIEERGIKACFGGKNSTRYYMQLSSKILLFFWLLENPPTGIK